MKTIRIAALLLTAIVTSPAIATTVADPTGDFLPSFTGTKAPDLDVTSFSVSLDPSATTFTLDAMFAGAINPAQPGFYVIGVDTGSAKIAPFTSIGEPGVAFNQVLIVQKDGSVTLGSSTLSAIISGNELSLDVPVSLLPSTGATPWNYGFNIWPRDPSVSGLASISDFAPNNSLLGANGIVHAVPEPATWMSLLLGFGVLGGALRFSRKRRGGAIAQIA